MGRKKPVAALGGRDFGGSGGALSSSNISSPNRRGSGGEASQQLPTAAQSSTSPTEGCSSAGAALTFSSCRMETRSNTSGSCGGIQEVNKGNSSSSSSTNHAGSSTSSVKGGDFVSDALLRDLEFEDFSRASCWEQLQHELVSCLRSLPIAADRSRFLQQVAAAHAEAAAAAAAAAPVHAPACMHRSAYCSSSWHAYAVPPPQFACLCSSPLLQQQQQRCALSLPLFSPLVLQQLVPIPRPPNYSRDSTEIPRDRLLRLTYTCSPPLPELGCCCSSNSSRNDSSSRRAYAAEPPAEVQVAEDLRHWSPSLSPIFFDSSSSGCGRSIRCSSSDGVSTNNKELRCGTCAACTLQWEQFFPSRAPSIQRSFGGESVARNSNVSSCLYTQVQLFSFLPMQFICLRCCLFPPLLQSRSFCNSKPSDSPMPQAQQQQQQQQRGASSRAQVQQERHEDLLLLPLLFPFPYPRKQRGQLLQLSGWRRAQPSRASRHP